MNACSRKRRALVVCIVLIHFARRVSSNLLFSIDRQRELQMVVLYEIAVIYIMVIPAQLTYLAQRIARFSAISSL
ncbi:MAG: hypothetical protein DWQ10_05365, partial [Calditrichaeota bacterium]